jgi:hypothetical protein
MMNIILTGLAAVTIVVIEWAMKHHRNNPDDE